MSKVKVYTFIGTVKELKERLAEREKAEKKNTLQEDFHIFEEKWNKITDEYNRDMKIINAKIEGRKIEDIRKFDMDRIDHDFQEEKDREDYDTKREEEELNNL